MKKFKKARFRIIALLLVIVSVFSGCSKSPSDNNPDLDGITTYDLMKNIVANPVPEKLPDEVFYEMMRNFASDLFRATDEHGKNTAFSPICVLNALALTSNGCSGASQSEISRILTGYSNTGTLNSYLATYSNILYQKNKFTVYTSLWAKGLEKPFTPENVFLQTIADYYNGKAYLLSENSNFDTCIENWLKLIAENKNASKFDFKDFSSSISIVSTLSGNASFTNPFTDTEEGIFKDGENSKNVTFLVSSENTYITMDYASGCLKYLNNGMSIALLKPEMGFSIDTVIEKVTGARLKRLLERVDYDKNIRLKIPAFSVNYIPDTVTGLKKQGVNSVFDKESAKLSGMFTTNQKLFLNSIYNPVSFDFSENGISFDGNPPSPVKAFDEEIQGIAREYVFNSPFIYIVFDGSGIPVIMGKIASV